MPLVRKSNPGVPSAPLVDRDVLAARLASGSDEARWAAARLAYEAPDGLSLLIAALSKETVSRVREAIFTSLARIGTPASAAVAGRALRSDDAAMRTAALYSLRAMPAAAAGQLPQLLIDPDADVRLLACEIARALPAEDASRMLCELLARDASANVCGAAIEVLAETGDSSSLPALAQCAARFSDDPFLAFAIQAASARIGSR
jgi:HEAT repeat protein